MTLELNDHLKSLKDVDGLAGSFIVDHEGDLVGRDMPSMFDDQTLNESAPRIQRIFDALEADGRDYHTCILDFGEHRLFIRKFVHGNLCALIGERANLPALKMATNLITKRLNQSGIPKASDHDSNNSVSLEETRTSHVAPQPNQISPAPSKARYYRGVKIN